MPTIRTAAPEFEPVSLTLAKLHCRVDTSADDSLFTSVIIPGAREVAEQELRRSIMLQTWRKTMDCFEEDQILLPWPNLLSVTSVQYRDTDANWQTLATSAYIVDTDSVPGRVLRPVSTMWPITHPERGSVKVTYTAGYASGTESAQQAAVPASVKNWMLLAIATAYEHRAELLAGVTVSALVGRFVDRLLDRERVYAPTDEDDDA